MGEIYRWQLDSYRFPEDEARSHARDFLVLPWHFMDEIQNRERDFLVRGGKLIAPLPAPYIINASGRHALGAEHPELPGNKVT